MLHWCEIKVRGFVPTSAYVSGITSQMHEFDALSLQSSCWQDANDTSKWVKAMVWRWMHSTGDWLKFLKSLSASLSSHQQRIRTSGLILLEAILFGALLLYFPVSRCSHRVQLPANCSPSQNMTDAAGIWQDLISWVWLPRLFITFCLSLV